MHIVEAFNLCEELERKLQVKGLDTFEVELKLNYCGSALSLSCLAAEPYDINGYWRRSKTFYGEVFECEELFAQASAWVRAVPDTESRAIEQTINTINTIADRLPKGTKNEFLQSSMGEIKKNLLAKAEKLGKFGLYSPAAIPDVKKELDDEIPF